ncbi:uncharacterized protein LOC142352076 isoform X2 [Convolutriloba macropyga]|uniref:uncharacterized protein LOC142352076 isoform X2 n=1 Tax=Convolutriloba macropyga TaxID=536237 RepID=UPI003F528627
MNQYSNTTNYKSRPQQTINVNKIPRDENGRPLGQLRVTGKAPELPTLLKLPPVEVYPSRSFEDTFVRGLQVGKPALVNASTQVNQNQILNPTPEPPFARPTPVTRNTLVPSDNKAVNAVGNANLTPGYGGRDSENMFWEEEVMEMRNHIQELMEELEEIKDREDESRRKAEHLEDVLREEQADKNRLSFKENEKLEHAQARLTELEPLETEVTSLRVENEQMSEKLATADKTLSDRVEQIEKQHVKEIANVKLEIEKDMFFKDDKINKLKKALEAMMSQKSNERQKQLDDMVKNFAKLQNECEILKAKLKHYEDKAKVSCQNCGRLSYKLEEKMCRLQSKEKQVLQYQEQNNQLRSQLVDQDRDMGKIIEDRAIETITIYKY